MFINYKDYEQRRFINLEIKKERRELDRLDASSFDRIYDGLFRNNESSITRAIENLTTFAKQGDFKLFFNKKSFIVNDLLEIYNEDNFFLPDILYFLKWFVKFMDKDSVDIILTANFIDFLRDVYKHPKDHYCQYQILMIYSLLMDKSLVIMKQYFSDNFETILINLYNKNISNIEEDGAIIMKPILRVLTCFLKNTRMVFNYNRELLEKAKMMVFNLINVNNDDILIECLKCINEGTLNDDISDVLFFYYDRYFKRFNELCQSTNHKIRLNMFSILSHFCILEKDTISRFLNSGFFDLEINICHLTEEERIQILIFLFNLAQFDDEFAHNVINTKLFNSFIQNVELLSFKGKEVLSQLLSKILHYHSLTNELLQQCPFLIQFLIDELPSLQPFCQLFIINALQLFVDFNLNNEIKDQIYECALHDILINIIHSDSSGYSLVLSAKKLYSVLFSN